jgi:histidine triad (HIT) family protein
MSNCIFCDILAGRLPSSFVHHDGRCSAFMDIQPVNAGHILVVPNDHATYLSDLDAQTGAEMFRTAQQIAAGIRRCGVRCEGIDLFLADGEAAGQEIFHVHLHIIPRYRDDGFGFRFPPGYHQRPERAELDRIAESVRSALL